ncbi:MAG: prepilin-type N-terminal cleavage/methylation domain-containing protein [Planctomycetota bacterium]|nr:prepilin-type N-terminal cleavage/methylation domain-containing protein [Planctomycetota bacterium]
MKTAAPVKRGFTLIELLVVMGIIGLLVMLLMPVVNYAVVVAQGVTTGNTIKRIEAGLAGFYGDFGVYPPSDALHETLTSRTAFGYKNLAIGLSGPEGTGWGTGSVPNKMPFGGTSAEKFGPYFEGGGIASIDDAFKPARPILYFRYEQSGDPEATDPANAVYDFNDNKATDLAKGEDGFTNQGNLMMLLRRQGTYQYVRRDYALISAGPDRVFGYRVGPDANGVYTFVNPSPAIRPLATAYTVAGTYCDDLANFKYEQY